MKTQHKRKTVGLLVSGITDPFSVSLIRGVIQAAGTMDIDVLVFPGKFLDRKLPQSSEAFYEYQFNTLYSYPARVRVDGLIISANSIGGHTSRERMEEFIDSFSGIPSVLAASPGGGLRLRQL